MPSVGLCVQLACVWEVTARKAGNVHRYRDFEDAGYLDFVLSAAAIAPVLDGATGRPVGQTILEAVRATRLVARTNTNLGIVLLLSPLAAVAAGESLRDGLHWVLTRLDVADACAAYEASGEPRPDGAWWSACEDRRQALGPHQLARPWSGQSSGCARLLRQDRWFIPHFDRRTVVSHWATLENTSVCRTEARKILGGDRQPHNGAIVNVR